MDDEQLDDEQGGDGEEGDGGGKPEPKLHAPLIIFGFGPDAVRFADVFEPDDLFVGRMTIRFRHIRLPGGDDSCADSALWG